MVLHRIHYVTFKPELLHGDPTIPKLFYLLSDVFSHTFWLNECDDCMLRSPSCHIKLDRTSYSQCCLRFSGASRLIKEKKNTTENTFDWRLLSPFFQGWFAVVLFAVLAESKFLWMKLALLMIIRASSTQGAPARNHR
ncbi:hypothetical protein YC2023_105752 [Brassica napus]